ncbi:MAG: acylphosphatase [Nitrospiraceae bacterium]
MTERVRAMVVVSGRVHGVGFRAFTHTQASALGLTGGVRNLPDGRVEAECEGPRAAVEAVIAAMRQGPARSRVDEVAVEWRSATGAESSFSIWY